MEWVPNWVHTGLDYAGLIPVYGAAFDGLNAGLYATEGDLVNTGISGFAAIPGAGDWASLGKIGKNLVTGGARFYRNMRGGSSAQQELQDVGVNPILASITTAAASGGLTGLGSKPFSVLNFLKNTGREGWQDFRDNAALSAVRQSNSNINNLFNTIGMEDPWQINNIQSSADIPSVTYWQEPNMAPVQRRLEQKGYWES